MVKVVEGKYRFDMIKACGHGTSCRLLNVCVTCVAAYYIYIYMCVYVCMYVCNVCMCVCMYVCTYVYYARIQSQHSATLESKQSFCILKTRKTVSG